MEDGTLEQGVAQGLGALHGFLVGRSTLDEMLMAIASTAGAVVPDIDLASITMLREGEPTTPVCTDKIALDVDLAQYAFGDGPCLAAMRHQGTEVVDVARDTRWPPVTARAGELGVVGILSIPLMSPGDQPIGGLNLYSLTSATFAPSSIEAAQRFGDQIGVAAANVARTSLAADTAAQLRVALESRAVIEQAKGILIAAQHCSPDEAFDILRRVSQRENRKLRQVPTDLVAKAQHLVD